jgi:predicted Zn-dependent peptidase
MNPTFPETLFHEVITNLKNSHRSDLTEGYARVSYAVNSAFFSRHPYRGYLCSLDSIDAITRKDVVSFYRTRMRRQNIRICAAGSIDRRRLEQKLNSTFGALQLSGAASLPPVEPLAGPAADLLMLDAYEGLKKDVAYVRGNIVCVSAESPQYWPLVLGADIVSDIMSTIIRTKHGLVYSVWAHPYNHRANYANISAYRTSDPVKLIGLIEKAIEIAAGGNCPNPHPDNADAREFVPFEEGLRYYKSTFSTRYYSGLQTPLSIAQKMASSWIQTGDYRQYLYVMERIRRATPEAVAEAVKNYFHDVPVCWAVTASPELIERVERNANLFAPSYSRITLN